MDITTKNIVMEIQCWTQNNQAKLYNVDDGIEL
jgi:hypothetical protein